VDGLKQAEMGKKDSLATEQIFSFRFLKHMRERKFFPFDVTVLSLPFVKRMSERVGNELV